MPMRPLFQPLDDLNSNGLRPRLRQFCFSSAHRSYSLSTSGLRGLKLRVCLLQSARITGYDGVL
jgi:hypothetical protein